MSTDGFQQELTAAIRGQLAIRAGERPDVNLDELCRRAVATALRMSADGVQQRLIDAICEQLASHGGDAADVDELAEQAVSAALEGPKPEFASLWEFVSQWLLPIYRRISDHPQFAWCPQWWRHPEAVIRLDALWRSWEHLRLEPGTGMSVWLKDHLYDHMPILLSQDGPMHPCKPTGHHERPLEPIPSDTPPASWITGDIAA